MNVYFHFLIGHSFHFSVHLFSTELLFLRIILFRYIGFSFYSIGFYSFLRYWSQLSLSLLVYIIFLSLLAVIYRISSSNFNFIFSMNNSYFFFAGLILIDGEQLRIIGNWGRFLQHLWCRQLLPNIHQILGILIIIGIEGIIMGKI